MKFSLVFIALLNLSKKTRAFSWSSSAISPIHHSRYTSTLKSSAISNDVSNVQNNIEPRSREVKIQYSESSLKHLEAVELKADYSRPWTMAKTIAISGAFFLGALFFSLGSYASTEILKLDTDQPGILTGGVGIGLGWYLFGGGQVMEDEKKITDKNGGYDAKLVADRPARLYTVLEDLNKMNEPFEVINKDHSRNALDKALKYIHQVHGEDYAMLLKAKCDETDRPVRFNPFYARTLIDQHSYDSAVNAVSDWMDSVDSALKSKPCFVLSRPPGHHACRQKGMGGCLFNNAAISAFYALDQKGVKNVAILDIDVHHGNGIAHCVQDDSRIRYCSIHEGKDKDGQNAFIEQRIPEDNPRTQDTNDVGPLKNLKNINLESGTSWEGYQQALVTEAIPFLKENSPDLLIVSAGFDALTSDWSSGLMLEPCDYMLIGEDLKKSFGNKVAFGLEGGYSFQNHALSEAIIAFCGAWDSE